ncbi:hydroxyacid dehydrogenase [Lewinellaceae bacterium SD302]|nr:hydroxyacid dehydrogenase [Lewinellaceae bacterium SD302]
MPDSSEQPTITFLDANTIGEVPNDDLLRELGNYRTYPNTEAAEVVDRLRGSTVAITNKVKIGRAEMDQLPDLKLICVAATGMNNIDLEAAEILGITVKNVAGYSTESVAQLTLTSLFTLAMDLIHLNDAVYDGTYSKSENFSYWRQPFYELGGARFGIIGMGTIGRRVARLAEAYGAEVVYYSTSGKNTDQNYPSLSLNELLTTCEVVSIHAPLNEATNNLLTYQELSSMKKSAYLLNMGRGGIVNEADLARAIDEEMIAGAAVDVFTREPLPEDHPYLRVHRRNRLLLTPHVGWASVEARMTLVAGVAKNIRTFLEKS